MISQVEGTPPIRLPDRDGDRTVTVATDESVVRSLCLGAGQALDVGVRIVGIKAFEVGRGRLEPPTSALWWPERCAPNRGCPNMRGVIRRDQTPDSGPARRARGQPPIFSTTSLDGCGSEQRVSLPVAAAVMRRGQDELVRGNVEVLGLKAEVRSANSFHQPLLTRSGPRAPAHGAEVTVRGGGGVGDPFRTQGRDREMARLAVPPRGATPTW